MAGTYTSPADEAFFAAIGRLTISWAYVETGISFLIEMIHHSLNGEERVDRVKPISLTRRLTYLRKAFRTLPELASFQDGFGNLATTIEAESETRHDIIHGFVLHHEEGTGRATLLRQLSGNPPGRKVDVTTEDILRCAIRMNKIRSIEFATSVAGSIYQKNEPT